jgi:hypothetical protein
MLAGGGSAQISYSEAPGNRSALYYGSGLTAICCLWVMSGTAQGFWASAWSLESAPACVDARKTSWWCRGRRGRRLPARHGVARRRRNRSDERVSRPPSGRAEECVDVFCLCSGSLYQGEWFPAPHDRGDGPAWCPLAGLLGSRLPTVSSSAARPSTPQRREARAQRGLTIRRQ